MDVECNLIQGKEYIETYKLVLISPVGRIWTPQGKQITFPDFI